MFAWSALSAFVVGLGLQPLVVWMMRVAAVLDVPTDRSSHELPTPRGGGLAVVLAVGVAIAFVPSAGVFVVPLFLFGTIGLLDDLHDLPVGTRLAAQVAAAIAVGFVLVPQSFSTVAAAASVVMVAIWLAAYVNAFNFMDGINGISGLHAILAGLVYGLVGARHDLPALAGAGIVTAAAALSFLPWNLGRARIFLGDVGSYGLGAMLGALAAYAVLHGVPLEVAIAPLGLYLADTGWTLLRRVRTGEAWYRPHRTHAYQRLVVLGWSHQRVAWVTAVVATAVSVCGLVASVSGPLLRFAFVCAGLALLASYLAGPSWLEAGRRRSEGVSLRV
jgi:UDP-N-acetylmuramyl pentapeptide phosphotransferase/UDP-N-acetylglucosamine-1-phosphate transferase